jgi:hypothetical protein
MQQQQGAMLQARQAAAGAMAVMMVMGAGAVTDMAMMMESLVTEEQTVTMQVGEIRLLVVSCASLAS